MNIRRRLQNPFFLVGQGFLLGAILFFAVSHDSGEARRPSTSADRVIQIEASPPR